MKKTVFALVAVSFLAACGGAPGEPGPKGDKGETGAAGTAGAAGVAGSPGMNQATQYLCTDNNGAYHDIYKFPDGSVITSCEIDWMADGVTSGFMIYKAGQTGATTATCLISGGARFAWNGNLGGTLTIGGTQTYAMTCTKY